MALFEQRGNFENAGRGAAAALHRAFLFSGGTLRLRNPITVVIAFLALCAGPGFARTIVVNQKSPRASDRNPGTEARPLKTIGAGAAQAQPGDTVLVHAGIYRERVSPPRGGDEGRPITYAGAPGEEVYVKGSEEWRPAWQPVAGHPTVFYGKLDPAMFGSFNPFLLDVNLTELERSTNRQAVKSVRPVGAPSPMLPQTRGQLFLDGAPLLQAESLEQVYGTRAWVVDAAGEGITVNLPPDDRSRAPREPLVEITARSADFRIRETRPRLHSRPRLRLRTRRQ